VRLLTVELPGHLIEEAVGRGLLRPEDRTEPWPVLQALYAAQLSDKALDWLTSAGVITREQRSDTAAILRGISDWLERAG
jgi:hypothetical protein